MMHSTVASLRGRAMLKIVLLTLLLAGSIVQLHVGLADNGDYTRLMVWMTSGPSGFAENWPPDGSAAYDQRFFQNLPAFWNLDFPMTARWLSSILLVWLPGVLLNMLLYSTHTLYLPFISFMPRMAVLLFLWMLLRWIDRESGRAAPLLYLLLGLPIVFIGFNTDYVAYFSSLYQEPASLIGLMLILLTAAYYNGREDNAWRPWISAAAVFFMTTAKLSNIHWALLGGLLLVPWEMLAGRPRRRAIYLLLIIAAPAGFSMLQASLYHTRTVNAYQSIYCGALVFSDHPKEHLDRLGMSDGAQYIGDHAFCEAGREAMERYKPLMTHRTVLDIMAHEPTIAWDMLAFAADSMQRAELTHLSKRVLYNEPHARQPWTAWLPASAAAATPLNAWTRLKRSAFPTGVPLIIVLLLLAVFPTFAWNHPHRLVRTLARSTVLLALASLIEMWMQIFGDGQRDLIKHLYLANICFDGALLSALGAALLAMIRWKEGTTE
ncbi:MAG: hypothetical protein IH600_01230 [Bacteroidetes bacterium]|nr:hypothetical protein [Bacteroidota bacterium]